MTRFALIVATTALLAAPSFAQTAAETAEEIINSDADNVSELVDATPVEGADMPDCMNPTAEVENASADTESEMIDCVEEVDGEPAAGEEIFEEIDEADDMSGTDG